MSDIVGINKQSMEIELVNEGITQARFRINRIKGKAKSITKRIFNLKRKGVPNLDTIEE